MVTPTPTHAVSTIIVSDAHQDQRIDNFLTSRLKGLPKSRLHRALRSGEVRVNGKRIKANYRVQAGDQIRIPPLRLSAPTAPAYAPEKFLNLLEKAIIFEDKDIIIVNKPSGVASHGGSGIKLGMIEGFRRLRPKAQFLELAHRLDRETTGCLILAKKSSVLKELHELFRGEDYRKRVKKTYLAFVYGRWEGKNSSVVDAPLIKNTLSSGERISRVHPEGKPAKTIFKVLRLFKNMSLVEASPLTGRTHQIRVHAAHMGHPILGDEKYDRLNDEHVSPIKVRHLLLHAASVEFTLKEQLIAVSACLDEEFKKLLKEKS